MQHTRAKIKFSIDCGCIHAEGPVWSPREEALYWVDIEGQSLHRYASNGAAMTSWNFDKKICSVALTDGSKILAAFADGIYSFDTLTNTLEQMALPTIDVERVRFNDGKCDRKGRFFAGTMDIQERQPLGALYRFDLSGLTEIDSGFTVLNGPAFNPDNTRIFVIDSKSNNIYCYDFDERAGKPSNKNLFVNTADFPGVPDGCTIDSEGFLWSARWDGSAVMRFDSKGNAKRIVELPTARPSSCMFGGADLKTLFVTTVRLGLTENDLSHQPLAGHILALDTDGISGLSEPDYKER